MQVKKLLPLTLVAINAYAIDNWQAWLEQVKQEALTRGIRQTVINQAFADVREPHRTVKNLQKSQPEHRLSYLKYRNTRVDAYRIAIGRKKFKENQVWLDDIAHQYHVDPCFMVSFWGLETSYGSYMGNFPVIRSLATLAYDSTRKDFFRNELFLALKILNEDHVPLTKFKGEWAGASGHPQFLPSSWMRYAVDYDGDGRKDIWSSKQDALASIANYMHQNGWHEGQPWAVIVKLPAHFDTTQMGKNNIKTTQEWDALGVRTIKGEHLPYANLKSSLIQPDGGPVFLAFPNYQMILKYNNSIFYAGAIGYLADKICYRNQDSEA